MKAEKKEAVGKNNGRNTLKSSNLTESIAESVEEVNNDAEVRSFLEQNGVIVMSDDEFRASQLKPLQAQKMSEIQAQAVEWLWNPFWHLELLIFWRVKKALEKLFWFALWLALSGVAKVCR